MQAAQLVDLGLDLGGQARGTVPWSAGAIQQTRHTFLLEPPSPAVQGLARDAVSGRDLTDRRPAEHFADSPIAVLGQPLYIHDSDGSTPLPHRQVGTADVQPNASTMSRAQTVKRLLRPLTGNSNNRQ